MSQPEVKTIRHPRASYEYTLGTTYTAGIVLTGAEVKSARLGHGSLQGSFVRILNGEAFLLNAQLSPYKYAVTPDYDPKRTRKLLLKKRELEKLQILVSEQGKTLVPLSLGPVGRRIKLTFAVGTGKKQHEKREAVRRRDERRQIDAQFKMRLKGSG